ncbi:MAG: adenylate/guanylate cyclase domain-containing protein, partial [Gammaproteobacteria bacterium]|nr:adenylate/guanylate cyclase domain-containing protein [Gammaproteobacteria bacterium]
MSEGKVERKVAVILATDVVGYSTRIEQNETQTLQTLKACREIIQELIGEHQGRVFNTAGDSVLAEFSSAVEAVLCASEFQRTIKERNDSVDTEAERMEFRIGVNMGDVVIEGDNLYGEGINVAARLEALAQSGGICLSKNVYDIVYNKMSLSFTDLGEQQVKDTVLHAVDVSLDGTGQRKLPGTKKAQSSTRMAYLVAGLAIITLMVGGGVWWQQQRGAGVNETEVRTQVVRDNLPIILVKPFKSLGGEDASVSNAITESLISSLSRYKMLSVLSSSTSFHILETKMPDSEIAQRFRVKHVIQG